MGRVSLLPPSGAEPPETRPQKRADNAAARAALLGYALRDDEDDRGRQVFIATEVEGAVTRPFLCIEDVEVWLDRLESRLS